MPSAILFLFSLAFLIPSFSIPSSAATARAKPAKIVWRKMPEQILRESIAFIDLKERKDYFEALDEAGYSDVELAVIGSTGTYHFTSLSLSQLGWPAAPDALAAVSAAWSRQPKVKGVPKVGLSLDVSYLAWLAAAQEMPAGVARPGVAQVDDALFSLMDQYRSSEVSFLCFPPEQMPVALGSFRSSRRGLNLHVAPPWFDRYAASTEFDEDSIRAYAKRLTIPEADLLDPAAKGRNGNSIGFGSLMFHWAATLGKEPWLDIGFEHPSWRNLVLFRMAQFAPQGVIGNEEDFRHLTYSGLRGDIDEFFTYSQNVPPAGKKVANLILGTKKENPEPLISSYIDPILNALEANGYVVRVTFGKILKGADLYYVVNGREWLDDAPLFDAIVDMMDVGKSHFYGTIILHPMGEITNAGAWARVREMFKLPNAEGGWIPELPDRVLIKMKPLDWGLGKPVEGRGMTRIRSIQAKNFGADVILSEVFDGATLGLIFKSGGHYLINGNFLKLGASYFLSKLMGGAIQTPAPIYVSSNRQRTCALALESGTLKLKPAVPDPKGDWVLSYFGADGERLRSETIAPQDTLEFDMKPYELLVLKTGP